MADYKNQFANRFQKDIDEELNKLKVNGKIDHKLVKQRIDSIIRFERIEEFRQRGLGLKDYSQEFDAIFQARDKGEKKLIKKLDKMSDRELTSIAKKYTNFFNKVPAKDLTRLTINNKDFKNLNVKHAIIKQADLSVVNRKLITKGVGSTFVEIWVLQQVMSSVFQ